MTSQHHRKDGRIAARAVSFATLLVPIAICVFILTPSARAASGKLGIGFRMEENYQRVREALAATRLWLT